MGYLGLILALVAFTEGKEIEKTMAHDSSDEQGAADAVSSSKQNLQAALTNQRKVASMYRDAVRNDTRADSVVSGLVEAAMNHQTNAADRDKAMQDYSTALIELQSASPSGNRSQWHNTLENAKKASRKVGYVDEDREHAARNFLRDARRKEEKEVHQSYHETMVAAKGLKSDANHLQHAMLHAGQKEGKVERESQQNEALIERTQGHAENQHDTDMDAVGDIFGRAEDRLMDESQSERQHAAYKRSMEIDEIMNKARTNSQAASAINLMEQPMQLSAKQQPTAQEAHTTVTTDKANLEKALDRMSKAAKDYRDANKNETDAKAFGQLLAQKMKDQAADAKTKEKEAAMTNYSNALSALQQATSTQDWKEAEKDARRTSDKCDEIKKQEEKDARRMLHQNGKDQKEEVRKMYHEAKDVVEKLRNDRKVLREARRRAGEERQYAQETMNNERFVETSSRVAGRVKDEAQRAVEHVTNVAEHHLQYLQRGDRHAREVARRDRDRAISDAVKTLKEAQNRDGAKKQVTKDVLAEASTGTSNMITALVAVASVTFLALFAKRVSKRPVVAAQRPLLESA